MTVSLVLLTLNRSEAVARTLPRNLASAGFPIHEIIHVDNGSSPDELSRLRAIVPATVRIENRSNLGVAKGYNRGIVLATGTYLVITGCDRIMPENWLARFKSAFEAIPETGVISIYTPPVEPKWVQRYRGEAIQKNGLLIQPAMPFEARIHRRNLLDQVGYFREDIGVLYSWEDCEWGDRVDEISKTLGLINYILPDMTANYEHGDTGIDFKMANGQSYADFKKACFHNEEARQKLKSIYEAGQPIFNPYVSPSFRAWK